MTEPPLPEESIFAQALEITSAAERAAFLDRACGHDQALRAEVEALLRTEARSGDLLDVPESATFTTDPPGRESGGAVIGPYKLLEPIGEGGMGTVWMAEQTDPIHRRVAVKVVKEGMDSRQVLARFEAERQALALMEHPHIAKVLDAGKTPSGRPYFVMEFVKGKPITDYCDAKRLGVRERLALFGDVCRAVQHAHQKGIIHRDLKPSNVLVAPFDGKPVVKVIDFGVAKATGQRLTNKTLFTSFGALVGTPEYMSPEQAEVNNQDIDTRSDIYSLGVLLYELLTGSTPLTRKRIKEVALLEVLRVIREEEPPRPSTRLSDSKDSLPSISAQRQSEPAKLTKLVRGELDWIVMKALEKDRNRRYETANSFALDVERFLADEPVMACPPSAFYRLRKFARRNKTALAVAGLILFCIALLGGGGGWMLRDRAAREEAAAKARRDREQRLTARVEQILDDVDRFEREQKWPDALAAAQRAEAALAGGEADDAVRQRVREVSRDLTFVARLDRTRQDRANAVAGSASNNRSLPKDFPQRNGAYGAGGETLPGNFDDSGTARTYAVAFRDYGVDVEALPSNEAVALLQRKPALAAPFAAALDDWVGARLALGVGESTWRPLIAVARGLDPDPLRDRIRATWGRPHTPESQAELKRLAESIDVKTQGPATLEILALTLTANRLPDSAVQIMRNGQRIYPGDFWLSCELGAEFLIRGQYAEAARYSSVAVSIRPGSADAHGNLGVALRGQKMLDDAVAEFRQAIELDPELATAHSNLGLALWEQGKLDEAVVEYRRAIRFKKDLAPAHLGLAGALQAKGMLDDAIVEYRRAIELGPKDALVHTNFGNALFDKLDTDGAICKYRAALEFDPNFAKAHNNLGNALSAKNDMEGAIREFRAALRIDPNDAHPHNGLGIALDHKNDLDGAVREYRAALAIDPDFAEVHNNIGLVLYNQKDVEGAIREYRFAIAKKPNLVRPHYNLGNALRDKNDLEGAIREYQAAIAINPNLAHVHFSLGNALRDKNDLPGAIAEYGKAIALKSDYAEVHCNLGLVLSQHGRFRDALDELRRGHELGAKRPDWSYPSAEWVRQCEHLIELDKRLSGILEDKTTPMSPAERIELALLCYRKLLYRAAVRFYEQAFAAAPKLAEDPQVPHRYNAACVAALAGCGQGNDAGKLDNTERGRLRDQALNWLRADLEAWGRLLKMQPDKVSPVIDQQLRHWLVDTDFAGVRGLEALAKLPETERGPWQKLWDDVANALARSQAEPAPEKKSAVK